MGTIYIEIDSNQSPKKGSVCGDVIAYDRTPTATTIVIGDGVGSGIKANVAATMAVSRLLELMRAGFSVRDACALLVETNEKAKAARETGEPYVAFTIIRILNDGEATILGYEMPAPLLLGTRHSSILPQRMIPMGKQMVGESTCYVEPGDAIMVFSDGVTTAGLGLSQRQGWGIEGANKFVNRILAEGTSLKEIPKQVVQQSRILWERVGGDDCTATLATCRLGETVNIFTGPPLSPKDDRKVVERFLGLPGKKIVCGASTAKIVATVLGKELTMKQPDPHKAPSIVPPGYEIEGIDLVTEGAVTLNQVYNILDEDPSRYEEDEVADICNLLKKADRVNVLMGKAANPGHKHISFSQRGILPRAKIIPLLREKLKEQGKLVVIDNY